MNINLLFCLFVASVFCFACVNETKSPTSTPVKEVKKSTSDLASRLYANFHNDPQTQDQKDENAIIDYAVDKGLNVKKTASGLYYVVHKEGDGAILIDNQPFKTHYSGYFLDGKVFDSSYNRGEPLTASVGMMNAGWNEALKMFKVGSKVQLLLPSRLGYGARGFPGFVPPNTPIAFDMEIMPF